MQLMHGLEGVSYFFRSPGTAKTRRGVVSGNSIQLIDNNQYAATVQCCFCRFLQSADLWAILVVRPVTIDR
jgi:hypothetical protein